MDEKELIKIIKNLINIELKNNNILLGQWHLGKIESIINNKLLSVFVDGSNVSQKIPCNPDIGFNINDEVWVVFINNDSKNKFVLCKRGV